MIALLSIGLAPPSLTSCSRGAVSRPAPSFTPVPSFTAAPPLVRRSPHRAIAAVVRSREVPERRGAESQCGEAVAAAVELRRERAAPPLAHRLALSLLRRAAAATRAIGLLGGCQPVS